MKIHFRFLAVVPLVLAAAAVLLRGQSTQIGMWDCYYNKVISPPPTPPTPPPATANGGCSMQANTWDGSVVSHMDATCFNSNQLYQEASADAIGCDFSIPLGATTNKNDTYINDHAWAYCWPDWYASWGCSDNWPTVYSGGCAGSCSSSINELW